MTIYTCERDLESILTCIYEAWTGGLGQKNIRLAFEPIDQYTLFDQFIFVPADPEKAEKVSDAICHKISYAFYREIAYASMSNQEDVADNLFRMLLLGFAYGDSVLDRVQYRDVMRNQEIRIRLRREADHFLEIARFHKVGPVFVAHIEPKSRLLPAIAPHFADRMPSENWMIVDDTHRQAVVHPKDEQYFFWQPTEEEFDRILETESENDQYTDLWKVFFESIAIEQRRNPECQRNLFPIWSRKHAVEFH